MRKTNKIEKAIQKYFSWKGHDDLRSSYHAYTWYQKLIWPFKYIKNNFYNLIKKSTLFFIIPIGVYLLAKLSAPESYLYKLLEEPSGNFLAELYGGYFFLYIALMIQRENDKKINELHDELQLIKNDRKYQRMIDFLHTGSHYNIQLDDYKDQDDVELTYTISPARDSNNNPICDVDDISQNYIVKVDDISFRNIIGEERLKDYLSSPVSPGEYYFVAFINGKWGFYDLDSRHGHTPFSWSGKNGGCRTAPNANSIMKVKDGLTEILTFVYDSKTGKKSNAGRGGSILKDTSDRIYVSPQLNSKPKRIFITYPKDDYQKESPFLKIENIFGYFDNSKQLDNFKELIRNEVREHNINLEELDWWIGDRIAGL